ncbi:MAG: hypothetical protein WCE66_09065, partial [Azonexus sp.]
GGGRAFLQAVGRLWEKEHNLACCSRILEASACNSYGRNAGCDNWHFSGVDRNNLRSAKAVVFACREMSLE